MDSSTSSTKSHTVNTSSHFDGIVTEFQVQSYNEVGDSPWSEAATATVLKFNNDKPLLSISKQGVTVKEGETETWTVKLNGALAGTVRLSEAERTHAGAIRLSPAALTFTEANYNQPQTVTVTGMDAGSEVFNGKRTGEVVVNHAFFIPAGSSTPTVAKGGTVEVMVEEEPLPVLQLLDDPATVSEGTVISLRVTADKALTGTLPVRLTLADRGSSGFGADDLPGPLTRTFDATFGGEEASATGTVRIPTSLDTEMEGAETYRITLNQGTGYKLGADKQADGTLDDGSGRVWAPATLTVAEEAGNATVRLSASKALGRSVRFNVSYSSGTATGDDYDNAVRSVTFNSTETTKDILIPITDDNLDEDNETFTVTIAAATALPGGFALGNATTTVSVTDDDASPVLAALADVSVTAGEEVDITASATDADGDTVSYTWSRKAGETTPALPENVNLNQARLTFTPTAAGVYTMTVTAEDGHGNSDSKAVAVTVSLLPPAAPEQFRARPGNGTVTLTWADPADSSITEYQVRQRLAGNGGGWSAWGEMEDSGPQTTSHVVRKLTNGQKYIFQVRAVNEAGEGKSSQKGSTPMGALTVAVEDGRIVEGDDGKKEMEFRVSLSGETVHDVKLRATATTGPGSTATETGAGRDFVPLSQAVVFSAYGRQHGRRTDMNDLVQTVRVEVVGDHLAEGDETFLLRLDNLESEDKRVALDGGGEKTSATGVIGDDDAAPVLAALADVTVTAGQEVAITASATDADGDTVSYSWSRAAGETTPALPQGTALNQAKLTFTPTAVGVYTMRVTADDGYGNTATEEVTVTVGAPATVSVPATLQVTEGTDSNAVVRITASKAFAETVTFNVSYGGSATADVDYNAVGTVTFNATDTSKDITIPLTDDNLDEDNETMTVRVTPAAALPGGFDLGNATTTVTITDDDASPVLATIDDVAATVGQQVNITASATDADGDTISYTWSRKAGETTPPLPQGTALNQAKLTFTPTAAGVYTMTVTADDGYGNTATEEVTVTVGAPATVSVPATLQVTEGTDTNAVVTVTASKTFAETVTFNVSYGGTATAEVDYDAVGTITFNATDTSKDIRIPLTDDNLDEDNETMTVSVTPAAALPGGFALENAETTVTIVDDDASPVLADMAPVSVERFETVDITASATDADGDTLSYRWSRTDATPGDSNYHCYLYVQDGRVWSTTELSGQRLRFTPATAGSCNMSVTVDDGHGNTASKTVVITVSNQQVSRPNRPTGLAAQPGDGEVTLTWDDPSDASITGYQFRQKADGGRWGAWTAIQGAGATTVRHTVTGLSNGTTHTYKIRALNGVGHSEESKGVKATPQYLRLTLGGPGTIDEGDEGQTEIVFTAQLSGSPSHDVRLEAEVTEVQGRVGPGYYLWSATLTGDERDVVPFTKTIVFPANARGDALRQEVRVTVLGDHRDEENELIGLWLKGSQETDHERMWFSERSAYFGAYIDAIIIDDDASPVLAPLADVTVTAGEEVTITASATDEDGDTVSYAWSRKAGETTPALPQGTALDQARLTFTPAAAGVYTMTVTADDGYGNTATEEVTITVGAAAIPAKPTGFKASGGNQQVILSWDDPGNANISKWQVRQKTGSNSYGPWADISGSGAATVSHTVTGLTNGTTYRFKIRAVAGAVKGAASDELSATPTVVVMAPRLTVTPQHGGDSCPLASLEWTVANTDSRALVENADSITGWAISYRFKLGENWEQWLRLPQLAPPLGPSNAETRSRVVMACVGNGDQMQFRVRAVGQRQGTGQVSGPWSNVETATFTTDHPSVPDAPKPTGLKASAGNQQVTLSWNQPRYNIIGWQVQQKAGSSNYGPWEDISGSDAATTSHTVTGLSNGTLYTFRIRAVRGKSKSVTDKTRA